MHVYNLERSTYVPACGYEMSSNASIAEEQREPSGRNRE